MRTLDYQAALKAVSCEIPVQELLVITPHGHIIHRPKHPEGVLVVDSKTKKPLFHMDEVSDEDTINLFFNVMKNTSGFVQFPEISNNPSEWELLANRKDLK